MNKAGGIVAVVAGIFSVIAAIVTLMAGGLVSAVKADGAGTVVALGWGGMAFSFLVIVFGAVALFKPNKGAGIALIVCSLAGAILGGTIVAVFMVLSLIGGILCVVGARQQSHILNVVQNQPEHTAQQSGDQTYLQLERLAALKSNGFLTETEFDEQKRKLLSTSHASGVPPDVPMLIPITAQSQAVLPKSSGKSKRPLFVGLGVVGVLILVSGILRTSQRNGPVVKEDDPLETLASTRPADIEPTGELAAMFTLGSDFTDLQRENKIHELTGQVIAWTLAVYDVSKKGDTYKVQTNSGFGSGSKVGAFVYLSVRNEEERRFVEALKTNDMLPFKGIITGSFMRQLEIRPAILTNGLYTRNEGLPQSSGPELAKVNTPPETPTSVTASDATAISEVQGKAPDVQVYVNPDGVSALREYRLTETAIKDVVTAGLVRNHITSIADNAVLEGMDDWVLVRITLDGSATVAGLVIDISVRNGASANNQLIRWQERSEIQPDSSDGILRAADSLISHLAAEFNSPAYKKGHRRNPTPESGK